MAFRLLDAEFAAWPSLVKSPGHNGRPAHIPATMDQRPRDSAQVVHPLKNRWVQKRVVCPVMRDQRRKDLPVVGIVEPGVSDDSVSSDRNVVLFPVPPGDGGGITDERVWVGHQLGVGLDYPARPTAIADSGPLGVVG